MLGTACQVDATAAQLNKKEHIERLQKESLHCEKITRQYLVLVVAHEMVPAWRTAPLGSTWDAMSSQNIGDGLVAEFDAQLGEFPCDLEVAPVSIFTGQ